MAPILSLATVSLNSRVSRHPPSERLNGVEATLVSDRACRSSTNEQRKINIPLGLWQRPRSHVDSCHVDQVSNTCPN